MPAMLKALLEQMLRPGFAFSTTTGFRRVRATIVGRAGSLSHAQCQEWLATLRRLGQAAA
jgi:hypothetical protein